MTKPIDEKPKSDAKQAPKAEDPRRVRAEVRPAISGAVYGRPMAASPAQRTKRRELRNSAPEAIVTRIADGSVGEILLYGYVSQFEEDINSIGFDTALNNLHGVQELRLRMNSGGGDVFEATAIYNMIARFPGKVTAIVEGVAASAMTLIAMAADEVRMAKNAHWMVHSAAGFAFGTRRQLEDYVKLLGNADDLLAMAYADRTGKSIEDMTAMLQRDNWMTADEALAEGFIDAVDDLKSVKPHVTPDGAEAAFRPIPVSGDQLAAAADRLIEMRQKLDAAHDLRVAASAGTNQGDGPSNPPDKEPKMNEELRAKCVAVGMPADYDDSKALAWLNENYGKLAATTQPTTPVTQPTPPTQPVNQPTNSGGATVAEILAAIDARDKQRAEAKTAFRKEVEANVSLAFGDSVPTGLVDQLVALQEDGIDAVREKITAAKKEGAPNTGGVHIHMPANQPRDRHLAALKDGVLVRALGNFTPTCSKLVNIDGRYERVEARAGDVLEKHFPVAKRAKDHEKFARMSLSDVAAECLVIDGYDRERVSQMAKPERAMAAMGYGAPRASYAAIHTTGSLLEITRDAVNKTLLAGYEEAPQTWRGPMRQAASVEDFKEIRRVKLGAAQNLPIWVDNTEPEEAKLSNEAETYAVEARAEKLSFSWQLIVNDDLDAISRRPQLMGDAAGRTVNYVAWQAMLKNPVMADGQTLILETPAGRRFRSNYTTGSATPTNASIGAMKAKMRKMRGLNTADGKESDEILNIEPYFIVGPTDLEETILKQVYSGADPASGGNAAVFNTSRTLTPIIEPLLDLDSLTAWYLFALPNRVDTIELAFLAGQETPLTHEWMDPGTMSQHFTIVQTYAARAIDFRGIQKHKGAA